MGSAILGSAEMNELKCPILYVYSSHMIARFETKRASTHILFHLTEIEFQVPWVYSFLDTRLPIHPLQEFFILSLAEFIFNLLPRDVSRDVKILNR